MYSAKVGYRVRCSTLCSNFAWIVVSSKTETQRITALSTGSFGPLDKSKGVSRPYLNWILEYLTSLKFYRDLFSC